jgi:hypothetical protein
LKKDLKEIVPFHVVCTELVQGQRAHFYASDAEPLDSNTRGSSSELLFLLYGVNDKQTYGFIFGLASQEIDIELWEREFLVSVR